MIMSYVISGRATGLIKHVMEPVEYDPEMGVEKWVVKCWIPKLREVLEEHGALGSLTHGVSCMNTELLFGLDGKLVFINKEFDTDIFDDYFTIGAGEDFAIGALAATDGLGIEPRERIIRAVKATIKHCCTVDGPIHVAKLGEDGIEVINYNV
jgi:hypothetical protein